MLRDNVQHHLEAGVPSAAFTQLHSLGRALWHGTVSVPELALRAELERATAVLELPISELAISSATQAVQLLVFPLPDRPGTVLMSEIGWEPAFSLEGATTLNDAFGSLVSELLGITNGATADSVLTVTDS
jgi:hypothetical protein